MLLNRGIGLLIARLLLGLIFFFQGYGKVFTWGVDEVYNSFFVSYNEKLPEFLTVFAAYFTSYVELIGGALLIIGFKRDWTLYALGLVLLIVSFGHGVMEPIWNLEHVMYRAILLIAILLLPKDWDIFSLAHLLLKKKSAKKYLSL